MLQTGAGMIISQGLMRMREYSEVEEAVTAMDWPNIAAGGTNTTHQLLLLLNLSVLLQNITKSL